MPLVEGVFRLFFNRRSGDVPDIIPEDADVSIFVKLLKVK